MFKPKKFEYLDSSNQTCFQVLSQKEGSLGNP